MKSLRLLLLLGVLLAPSHRLDAQVRHEFTEVHMGMRVRIVLFAPPDTARIAARAAFRRIAALEDIFSDYRATSELRQLEQHAGKWTPVSAALFDVLQRAQDIARRTDGAFDATVGAMSALWRAARARGTLPDTTSLDSVRAHVGWQKLALDTAARTVRLPAGMRLDVGGIAKGYILQQALRTIEAHGVRSALIEAGGDVLAGAAPPGRTGWKVDVPGADSAFTARAARLAHAALATSGPTSQYLEAGGQRHSHVLDARTGRAITGAHVVYVIAPDAATADALATALSVLGPEGAARLRRDFPDAQLFVTGVTSRSSKMQSSFLFAIRGRAPVAVAAR